jgi:copper chaperone CopZ
MKRLRILLPDLTCASCVSEIEKTMRQQEGVIWATVNYAAGDARIIYDPAAFNIAQLMRSVKQMGHKVRFSDESIELTKIKSSRPRILAWMRQQVRTLSR